MLEAVAELAEYIEGRIVREGRVVGVRVVGVREVEDHELGVLRGELVHIVDDLRDRLAHRPLPLAHHVDAHVAVVTRVEFAVRDDRPDVKISSPSI